MNRDLLKAEIVKNRLTQKELSKQLGFSEQTFSRKLKRGVFGTDEVEKMINILHISNPVDIFLSSE